MNRSVTRPFVIALLVVQVVVSASLWILDAISVNSTASFALLLAAELLVFAIVCHTYFFSDTEAADAAVGGASVETQDVQTRNTLPTPPQPLLIVPSVTSRGLRIGVPVFSILTLAVLAVLIASGQGTTLVFIPIFLAMVVVYVLASIYLFKLIIEKDQVTTGNSGASDHGGHEVH